MRVSKPRNRAALAVLGLAAAAVFVLPASPASALEVSNACRNSVTANNSQIGVDTTATDSPDPVAPGATVTLSNLSQTANVPGAIFVAGYNLGLLTVGNNTIPATVSTFIEGTNTVEGVQQTNFAATSISTTITDPDGIPSTGNETATDGTFSVTYNNQTWTAGASGTIEFREDTRTPLSVAAGAEVGGIIIRATIGGFLSVRFACSPGTVTPPDPGTVTFIDPAPAFETTVFCLSVPGISIDDQAVTEGGAATFTVSFFGCGAGSALVTVDFATADGTATAPADYTAASGTLTFAPGVTSQTVTVQTNDDAVVELDETFFVNLSNLTGGGEIFDGMGVGTILNVPVPVIDGTGIVIVNGPVSTTKTSKSFVFKMSNIGLVPITVDPSTDVSGSVDVNGTTTGSVSPNPGTKTIGPGASTRVKLVWSYPAGSLVAGDTVVFHACVNLAGDIDTTNDCDDATVSAK
ncbi:MAG TPA: Calx-beta domain-containing protein [Solirubrobacterales bacterium]